MLPLLHLDYSDQGSTVHTPFALTQDYITQLRKGCSFGNQLVLHFAAGYIDQRSTVCMPIVLNLDYTTQPRKECIFANPHFQCETPEGIRRTLLTQQY